VLNILPTEIEYEDDEAEDVLEVVGQVEEEVEAVVALFAYPDTDIAYPDNNVAYPDTDVAVFCRALLWSLERMSVRGAARLGRSPGGAWSTLS